MKLNTNQELYNQLLREGKIFPTSIKYPYGNNVFSAYTSNRFYDPAIQSFNIYYLKSPEFTNTINKNPLYLGFIPPQIYNENDIWDLIKANPLSIINFDESYIQPNMYATAVLLEPKLLGLLNERFQTIEIVTQVIKKEPLALQYVRDDLKYFYICQSAVSLDWRAIEFVPPNIVDSKLIEIAQQQEDAFLLDKVERSKLESDFYVDQLVKFPIDGATHIIAANLVNNAQRINELIYFIENLNAYAPEYIFDNCDPKILLHHEKHNALVALFTQRPQWITYLKPHFISEDIFKIALENGIYPKLDSLCWSGEMISLAFAIDKKAYMHLPYDRLKAVGATRISQTVNEAMLEGWIDKLPKYFITDEVVNDQELRHALILSRAPFSYFLTQSHQIDWERVEHLDGSIAEYRMLKQSVPTELADTFFEKNIESYIALADDDKTLDRTSAFLSQYPNEIRSISKKILDNPVIMKQLIQDNPLIGRYLDQSEIINLFA